MAESQGREWSPTPRNWDGPEHSASIPNSCFSVHLPGVQLHLSEVHSCQKWWHLHFFQGGDLNEHLVLGLLNFRLHFLNLGSFPPDAYKDGPWHNELLSDTKNKTKALTGGKPASSSHRINVDGADDWWPRYRDRSGGVHETIPASPRWVWGLSSPDHPTNRRNQGE